MTACQQSARLRRGHGAPERDEIGSFSGVHRFAQQPVVPELLGDARELQVHPRKRRWTAYRAFERRFEKLS
jgi:hypothetical protein